MGDMVGLPDRYLPYAPQRFFWRMDGTALMGLSDDDWGRLLPVNPGESFFQLVERFPVPKDVFGEVVDAVFFLIRCVMIDELHEIFKRFFCPAVFLYAHPPPLLAGMVHKS